MGFIKKKKQQNEQSFENYQIQTDSSFDSVFDSTVAVHFKGNNEVLEPPKPSVSTLSENDNSNNIPEPPRQNVQPPVQPPAQQQIKVNVNSASAEPPKQSTGIPEFDAINVPGNQDLYNQGAIAKTEKITKKSIDINAPSTAKRNSMKVGMSSVIGRRESQQDAVAVSDPNPTDFKEPWFGILCDGMGGMNGGELASALCIEMMLNAFLENKSPIPEFFRNTIISADVAVANLKDANGDYLGAGSTFVGIVISGSDLYWASVGDSHIYVLRDNEMALVTNEHNYLMELMKSVKRGEITLEEAQSNPKREALISYMGMGDVSLMDVIEKPFFLKKGDIVLLSSDGLYRALSDEEIFNIIRMCGDNMQLAAEQLTDFAISKNFKYQDNTSVVLIKY